jgi:hypothetical protein
MRLALVVVLVAAAAAAGVATAQQAELPTRDCRSRIESGRGPLAFAQPRSVAAGPVSFSGLLHAATPRGLGPRGDDGRFARKAGVSVRAGGAVVLSVPERYRQRLFLHYTRTEEGSSAVRLEPCPPGTPAFSYDGPVGRVTGFNGGFSTTHRGCYPLDVAAGRRTYRLRIALGYPCR